MNFYENLGISEDTVKLFRKAKENAADAFIKIEETAAKKFYFALPLSSGLSFL